MTCWRLWRNWQRCIPNKWLDARNFFIHTDQAVKKTSLDGSPMSDGQEDTKPSWPEVN